MAPATTRRHRVGLTASAVGLLALFALDFASVSPNRVVTGTPLSIFAALPMALAALPAVLWLTVVGASLRFGGRTAALVRGICAAGLIAALAWLSGEAASVAAPAAGTFGRYSVGGGVWLSAFAAFSVVVASRREVGLATPAGWAMTLAAPVAIAALALTGRLSDLGMAAEYRNVSSEFWVWVWQQFAYAAVAIAVATVFGVALGILARRSERAARVVFAVTSVFQTIPGLAMVGLLVVPLGALGARVPWLHAIGVSGLGWSPVVVALTLYALLAIVRNTYAGLGAVPADTVEAGRGMGMSGGQVLRRVELPLATPIVFSGIRTASQQTIGNATLGAFVAAGTLGAPIFLGFAQQANDLVLLGSIALVTLAIAIDGAMRATQRLVTPAHSRKEGSR